MTRFLTFTALFTFTETYLINADILVCVCVCVCVCVWREYSRVLNKEQDAYAQVSRNKYHQIF
jgi:hypothetical protein